MAENFDLQGETVRLSILKKIVSLYEAATELVDGIKFSDVHMGPLGPWDARKRLVIGVVPGPEGKSDLYPLIASMLEVNIEFRLAVQSSDAEPGVLSEKALGIVQQVIYRDRQIGMNDTVISVNEVGNEVDLYTYSDRSAEGLFKVQVHYRHNTQTVFSADPSV